MKKVLRNNCDLGLETVFLKRQMRLGSKEDGGKIGWNDWIGGRNMKYAIVYSSRSGNTALLAEALKEGLPKEGCRYFGTADLAQKDANAWEAVTGSKLVLLGFWTDKGNCDEKSASVLKKLRNQKIFLFGTAGFGGSEEYFQKILTAVKQQADPSNTFVGSYLCQGKMSVSVRRRYETMLAEKPGDKKILGMLENFDRAQNHPNEEDCGQLLARAGALVSD
ncbi:flavodoxin family protein BilS [Cuneatibacter sp. NSJ-177]|uniref:flavodoxin family protein BilS n=1 Tax=Cuneatibacter sp. NSJ-177 TaxID=2931401 RepID=UPI002ED21695